MCQRLIMELERCCSYHLGHPDCDSSHPNFHFDLEHILAEGVQYT